MSTRENAVARDEPDGTALRGTGGVAHRCKGAVCGLLAVCPARRQPPQARSIAFCRKMVSLVSGHFIGGRPHRALCGLVAGGRLFPTQQLDVHTALVAAEGD